MSSNEAVKAAVVKLETEIKNYYKSANEVFYTSIGYSIISFFVFIICSVILPGRILPIEGLKSLIGVGGGGATSGITLSWGFKERLDRRDKARQIEAQKESLEILSKIPSLESSAQENKIIEATLELTLRTISSPYEFSRSNTISEIK